jgi:hypothetical protein
MIQKIKTYILDRREEAGWNHPDYWHAAVLMNGDQVRARIKNNLALLEGVPKPETGYHYKDVVNVIGPVGKQFFRDDEINEYKATGVYKKSEYRTFSFEAILPRYKDYFCLLDSFKKADSMARFPWSSSNYDLEWRRGYCAAINIERVKDILKK